MRANWFIAWPVDVPSLRSRLGEVPDDVRTFASTDRHITLAFLGSVGAEAARKAFDALDATLLSRVEATFGDVVLMGHPKRGTALSAEIDQGCDLLAKQIGERRSLVLDTAGARPDKYAPRPHMTIARIRRRVPRSARETALRWAAGLDLSGLCVSIERIALYTWSDERPRVQFRFDRERALQ